MTTPQDAVSSASRRFVDTPTRTVRAAGTDFVYRSLGMARDDTPPLIALTHLGANLDSWDPEVVDPIASERHVILLGYRGVGASTGTARDDIDDLASDAIAAIRALGHERIDLFGLSMGGMVAQAVIEQAPELVDRLVLASSGPRSGPELTRMTGVMVRGIARGLATFTNPTNLLFFTRTRDGKRAAREYQARLKQRTGRRDGRVSPGAFRAQLRAVKRWGNQPAPRAIHPGRVLILHGDSDRMVRPENSDALLTQFTDPQLRLFPDSGHGVVFQHRRDAVDTIERFLRR